MFFSPARFAQPALLTLTLVLLSALPLQGYAASDPGQRGEAANEVLQDLARIPEQAIPPNLLNSAYAVAIVPNVIKGGFFVGGSFGKGVLLVRQGNGIWSNPACINLVNLSFGWQLGVQGADLVLVFKTRRGVDNIAQGKFTLGGSAAASAGPVGRTALAMTDGEFKSEIYTYARSRGLFAGVALEGGTVSIDLAANAAWYGKEADVSATRIFTDTSLPVPVGAANLLTTLATLAPPLQWAANPTATPAAPAPLTEPLPPTTTYPVDEGAKAAPETRF